MRREPKTLPFLITGDGQVNAPHDAPVRVSIGSWKGRGKHLLGKIQVLGQSADEVLVKRVGPLRAHRPCPREETGASLVEFALVLPVFLMLMLGMFTGGLAYSRKQSVAQGAREAARYGATLPITASLPVDAWLDRVATLAKSSSDGELGAAKPGQIVCVAYLPATGTPRSRQESSGAVSFTDAPCVVDDGRAGETRVQVVTRRVSKLEALVFSRDLSLDAQAVARYEAP